MRSYGDGAIVVALRLVGLRIAGVSAMPQISLGDAATPMFTEQDA